MTALTPSVPAGQAAGSRLCYSINDVARITGLGRSSLYELIGNGDLSARKVGRRTVILADDLKAWLRSLPMREFACSTTDDGRGE
ncbi:MAG: helix-turn-helix domain-containing protein [Kiloniellaceae bacterium]